MCSIKVQRLKRPIRVKIASERDEFEQAFRLLSIQFQASGLEKNSSNIFRFSKFHALPHTITLIAKYEKEVIATFSLVPDTFLLGLPLESIYDKEIKILRSEGRRLAEGMSLASKELGPREFMTIFNTLIKLAIKYHLYYGGDSWVLTANPRHRNYYVKTVGFISLGPPRLYPSVQNYPAEAFLLDMSLMRKNAPKMYDEIMDEDISEEILKTPKLTSDHFEYFGKNSTQTDYKTIVSIREQVANFGGLPRWREQK